MPPGLRILEFNSMLTGGGTDDRSVQMACELIRLGCRLSLVAPTGREYGERAVRLGVPLLPVSDRSFLRLLEMFQLASWIRQERAQIVQAPHGRDYWPTVLAARWSGVRPRVVLFRHLAKSPSSWFSRHFLLNRCDAMVAASEFVARVLREGVFEPESPVAERRSRPPLRGDHRRIRVNYFGFDLGRFQPGAAAELRGEWGLAADHYAFAVVGGYDLPRGKGHREFLEAAARIHQRFPQARFLIVGRGNLRPQLEADIERLGLPGKAWLTPYCQDMPQAMNAIDCLVHPQVGTEALGGVVLEAYACGRPVIASDLDGIPEAFAVGNYGQLVSPGDVDQLAAAMGHWAPRPPLDLAARQALHDRVEAVFSRETTARSVLGLYQDLLGTTGTGFP